MLISIIIWKLIFDPIVIGPKNKTMQNNVNFYFYIDVLAKNQPSLQNLKKNSKNDQKKFLDAVG